MRVSIYCSNVRVCAISTHISVAEVDFDTSLIVRVHCITMLYDISIDWTPIEVDYYGCLQCQRYD